MKNNEIRFKLKIILMSISLLLYTSCTDLEEVVLDEVPSSSVGADDIEGLASPVYNNLMKLSIPWNVWAMMEVTSDEAVVPTRGTDWDDGGNWRDLHLFNWKENSNAPLGAWDQLSKGISKANTALSLYDNIEMSQTLTENRAEVTFLRAFFGYYFMDLFGQMAYRDYKEIDFSAKATVMKGQELFDWIVKEVETALPGLIDGGPSVKYGKINKAAAYTLLMKLYLNKKTYLGGEFVDTDLDKVIEYGEKVQTAGYTLNDDYFDMFDADNDIDTKNGEAILVAVLDENVDLAEGVTWFHPTMHYNITAGGRFGPWNGFSTTKTFVEKFDTAVDKRYTDVKGRLFDDVGVNLGFVEGQIYAPGRYGVDSIKTRPGHPLSFTREIKILADAAEYEGVRVLKYAPSLDAIEQTRHGADIVRFRYSDVLLMIAEAKFRKDKTGQTEFDELYKKRRKGTVTPPTISLEELLDERGRELYWEGHRRQDLIRFDKFIGSSYTWEFKNESAGDDRKLFKIPQSALDINDAFDQN